MQFLPQLACDSQQDNLVNSMFSIAPNTISITIHWKILLPFINTRQLCQQKLVHLVAPDKHFYRLYVSYIYDQRWQYIPRRRGTRRRAGERGGQKWQWRMGYWIGKVIFLFVGERKSGDLVFSSPYTNGLFQTFVSWKRRQCWNHHSDCCNVIWVAS